jgi:hypothetical protein
MKKVNPIVVFFLIVLNSFIFTNLQSQISNSIMIKVGDLLITSIDIQNEIITNLVLNEQDITQENINNNKSYAVKKLINKSIKRIEINKYKIEDYSKKDLQDYTFKIAKQFGANLKELKEVFKRNNIDYETFVENHKTELLWNTLIFQLYKNQTNVNIVEVENEVEKIKDNKSDEELKKIKINILNKKKSEKLNLFSRSHYSNLENTVVINFNE